MTNWYEKFKNNMSEAIANGWDLRAVNIANHAHEFAQLGRITRDQADEIQAMYDAWMATWDDESARVEAATRETLARAGVLAQDTTDTENKEEKTMKTRKHYLNSRTGEDTASATQAMKWHRAGDLVQVNTYYNEPHKTGLANVVHIPGAAHKERDAEKENRAHCKHIALEVEAYADGQVYRCPECDEILHLPDNVGDKYRCPHCEAVQDVSDLEMLGIWDYMSDILDIEYRAGSDRTYRSCRIMVACGGPNIYIDTASRSVDLYWWNERATYLLSYDVCDAIDEWAEEYWNL